MKQLKYAWKVTRKAGVHFDADNCYRYSAALSFYTLFSIAPVIYISIYVAGIFANDVDFRQLVSNQLSTIVGESGAKGVTLLLESLENREQTVIELIIGIFVLLFSATNIFIQIQGAINEIFKVKPLEDAGVKKIFKDRITSLGMILILGFVMLISLILDSIVVAARNWLERAFSELTLDLITIGENLVIGLLTFGLIYALFKILPDVKVPKAYLIRSSLVITILLLIGKFAINWYISSSRFSDLGGASASIIILMLWVYYSSYILFFGAELIRAMGSVDDHTFRTNHFASRVKLVRVEKDND